MHRNGVGDVLKLRNPYQYKRGNQMKTSRFVVFGMVCCLLLCAVSVVQSDIIITTGGSWETFEKSTCKTAQPSNTSTVVFQPPNAAPGTQVSVIVKETYRWPDDSCGGCGCPEPCSDSCTLGTVQGTYGFSHTTVTVIIQGTGQIIDGPTKGPVTITKTSRKSCG
jgi:hypothetical protein